MAKYNKNGQVIADDEDINTGVNPVTKENSNLPLNAEGVNEPVKVKDKDKKKAFGETLEKLGNTLIGADATQNIFAQGLLQGSKPNLVLGGAEALLLLADKKGKKDKAKRDSSKQTLTGKELPEGSSKGTDTIPIEKEEQTKVNTSNDVTRQEKELVAEAADESRAYNAQNDLTEKAEEARQKYDMFATSIDPHYTEGLPRSIIHAWQSGKFGEKDSKDAKKIRNMLIANSLGTMLSNMGAGIKGGESKESLWAGTVRDNLEKANQRSNDKFNENMKNQMNLLNMGALDQLDVEKKINDLMADSTMSIAMKHANNIEDTMGLWYLRQAMGESWNKMTSKEKMGLLNAYNASSRGDVAGSQALLVSALGDEEAAEIAKKINQYAMQQQKANADMAQSDARYRGANNLANTSKAWIGVGREGVGLVQDSVNIANPFSQIN